MQVVNLYYILTYRIKEIEDRGQDVYNCVKKSV